MKRKCRLEIFMPYCPTSEPDIFDLDNELLKKGFNLPFKLPYKDPKLDYSALIPEYGYIKLKYVDE